MTILFSNDYSLPTNINISALQQILDKFKEQQPILQMSTYLSSVDQTNMCATSCCLAGWGLEWKIATTPEMDAAWNQKKSGNVWHGMLQVGGEYGDSILDTDDTSYTDVLFEWVFGGSWNNDHGAAIKRLEYIIQHGTRPAWYSKQHHSNISLTDLVKQLPSAELRTHIHGSDVPPGKSLLDINSHFPSLVTNVTGSIPIPSIHVKTVDDNYYPVTIGVVFDDSEFQTLIDLITPSTALFE